MSRILVGSTLPSFAMGTSDWHWWISNAERIAKVSADHGHEVEWLAVLEIDARGLEPFFPLLNRMGDFPHSRFHTFSVDRGEQSISSESRFTGICIGRNLIIDHAIREKHDYIYFADSDIEAPDDILVRLLDLDWPVTGGHVPTYCLNGQRMDDFPGDTRKHWNTAGSLLVAREVFRQVPWRWDPDDGCTDDPATQHAMEKLGYPTMVRHDVICRHHPEAIGPLEARGLDLQVRR